MTSVQEVDMDHGRLTRFSALAMIFAALLACKKSSSSSSTSSATPPATAAAPAAPTGPVNPADVSGKYKILSAANPGGKGGYAGTVAIEKHGDMFSVDWTIANTPPYKGVGIVDGQVFGVGWGLGKAYGVAVYKVSGGNLDGKWATSTSQGRAGTEKLSGPSGLNGTYKITDAKDGDSLKPYTGSVTITPAGSVYNVTWNIPGSTYSGVGILEGDVFTVGWGTEGAGAGVVVYKVGDKLDGKWAQPKGTQVGTEVLGKI